MTVDTTKLAILGGHQAVPESRRTFKHPLITEEVSGAVLRQLESQISIYDDGGVYRQLEAAFAELTGARFVLSVNSGTTALLSMYFGLGLKRGDEVIVPAYTFFATATPLFHLGVVPVAADCADNGNVTVETIRAAASERTRAVVVTHMWGVPCDMAPIRQYTSERRLALLEDASHAHGATYHGKYAGTLGDAAAWSLQGKKILSAGEGGLFATDDEEMFQRAVLLGHFNRRAHRNVTLPHLKPYRTTGLGLNLRMHPLGAALAYAQLPGLEAQLQERREVAAFLAEEMSAIDGLKPVTVPEGARPAWYAFPLLFEQDAFRGVSKERFVAAVSAEGATEIDIPGSTRNVLDYPLFRHPENVFDGYSPRAVEPAAYPNAQAYQAKLIKLPVWYGENRWAYAEAYVRSIRKVCANRAALR
jgi:dTDP-4-amino-4,6-dideoxygalactose transaminase